MKKTAPTFAYETVYKKLPPEGLRQGRPPFEVKSKIWKNLRVDYDLKDKWLENLNNIPGIEIRSTCAGHNKEWVSFVIFRLLENNPDIKKLDKIKKELKSNKNTFCDYELGMEKKYRIICASDLYAGGDNHKEWEKWWSLLPYRINKAVKK